MFRFLMVLAAALLAATPATAQVRKVENPPEVWVHKGTGAAFPARVAEFQRATVTEYNADGTDASVGYNLVRDGVFVGLVTIYVYPPYPIGGCPEQFADVKKSINQTYGNITELIPEKRVPSPGGGAADAALLATYDFDAPFDNNPQRVHSEAYLFCATGGNWLVAYRATWPVKLDLRKEVDALIRGIRWPEILDR